MIKIIPAEISMPFVGKHLHFSPRVYPNIEFINVMTVIKIAGFNILFPYKDRLIPAENASMLVAIPISNRQVIPIQFGVCFFVSKASLMNFIPRKTNIVNTIKLAYGVIYSLTNCVKKYPMQGIKP